MNPFLENILDGLVAVATQFSSEVLGLCLETLTVVIMVTVIFFLLLKIYFLKINLHINVLLCNL